MCKKGSAFIVETLQRGIVEKRTAREVLTRESSEKAQVSLPVVLEVIEKGDSTPHLGTHRLEQDSETSLEMQVPRFEPSESGPDEAPSPFQALTFSSQGDGPPQ